MTKQCQLNNAAKAGFPADVITLSNWNYYGIDASDLGQVFICPSLFSTCLFFIYVFNYLLQYAMCVEC